VCPEKLEEEEAKGRARRSAERMSGSTRLLFLLYEHRHAMPLRADSRNKIPHHRQGQGLRLVARLRACFPSLLLKKHEITDRGLGRGQSQQRQLADLLAEVEN
jgi:hypothetical protein